MPALRGELARVGLFAAGLHVVREYCLVSSTDRCIPGMGIPPHAAVGFGGLLTLDAGVLPW